MKIMVGIDGSQQALTALGQGALFARAVDAQLVLLRVLNPVADCADMPGLALSEATDQLKARWMSELAELARVSRVPSVVVEVLVKARSESTADAIVRVANRREVHLVVLGTHGTGIARRALIGSVATQVLQRSHQAVMLTGEHVGKPNDVLPYRVLIGTDGCDPSGSMQAEFTRAVEGVLPVKLSVTAVHVSDGGYALSEDKRAEAAHRLAAFTARLPQRLHPEPTLLPDERRRGPTEAIVAYAKETGPHSIWMATTGRPRPGQVFPGSTALSAVEHAHIPIVLLRASEA